MRINVVGIGRFIIACKADSSFITEDIREAKEKRDRIEKEYEKLISSFNCMTLSVKQMRVLDSLERLIVLDDIQDTKKLQEKQIKDEWRKEWEKQVLDGLSLVADAKDDFFLAEDDVIRYMKSYPMEPATYLMAMESVMFTPYYPLFDDAKKNKAVKKLKCNSDYLLDKFTDRQAKLTKEDFTKLQKEYKHSARIITGSNKNILIGVVATTVVVAATGGLAFTFAPAIATVFAGNAAAGLSGAALYSYSLAAVGGGSLAAGGLGMAGGTAIITGGGALLGMLGSGGISAVTTVNLLSDNGYVLSECCKLLTFSREVLINRFRNAESVFGIKAKIDSRSLEVSNQIDVFEALMKEEADNEKKKEMKTKVKIARKSLKYLDRTADELGKLIKASGSVLSTQLALPGTAI